MGVVALVTQHSGEAQPLLNNRDLAALFWLAVLVVFAIVKRINVRPVLQAMKGSILLVFVGLGMWTWLEVNLGARLGWWTGDLLKDTVVWYSRPQSRCCSVSKRCSGRAASFVLK